MKRMRVTDGGQISLPAEIRRRWQTRTVALDDRGDHVVVRPQPDDPIKAARGALAGRLGRSSHQLRRLARAEDESAQARRSP